MAASAVANGTEAIGRSALQPDLLGRMAEGIVNGTAAVVDAVESRWPMVPGAVANGSQWLGGRMETMLNPTENASAVSAPSPGGAALRPAIPMALY